MATQQTVQPEAIFQTTGYLHFPTGAQLVEHLLVSGTLPDDYCRFTTKVIHDMQLPGGKMARGQRDLMIPADTIQEAFAMLPSMLHKAVEDIETEIRQKVLMVPGAPPLINGKGGRMGGFM